MTLNRITLPVTIWITVALTVLAAAGWSVAYKDMRSDSIPKFNTPFQAVLLDSGQVYYGKLSGLGTEYPKMTDAYYIVKTEDPKTKQVEHVLVKRGKELHAPTETFFNVRHIIMIEPVGPDSKVAHLIEQSQSQAP